MVIEHDLNKTFVTQVNENFMPFLFQGQLC